MSRDPAPTRDVFGPNSEWRDEAAFDRFEDAWKRGERPRIEDYLGAEAGPPPADLLRELLRLELYYRARRGESPARDEYLERFPEDLLVIDEAFPGVDGGPPVVDRRSDTSLYSGGAGPSPGPGSPPGGPGGAPSHFGKIRVLARLGGGGMGVVYHGYDDSLDRDVAVKVIKADIAGEAALARFDREAKVMAKLSHDNAVGIHQAERLEDGSPYIVMEYVEGASLDKVLVTGVAQPLGWVAELLYQLCDVLQFMHEKEIVHRDLKPANLILVTSRDGRQRLKVFDFGIAKILGDGDAQMTVAGVPIGSAFYMSPEQVRGDESVSRASDIYSVGVLLYEFLCGNRPFDGSRGVVMDHHLKTAPTPFSKRTPKAEVPAAVEELVMSCLAKTPGERPGSARELGERFREALSVKKRRWTRRSVLRVALSAPAAVATAGGVWTFWSLSSRYPGGPGPLTVAYRRQGDGSAGLTLNRDGTAVPLTLVRIPPVGQDLPIPFGMNVPGHRSPRLITPFHLATTETTRAQFDLVMGRDRPLRREDRDLPVTGVNWLDAVAFCKRLQVLLVDRIPGVTVRLPMEIEWEYAATCGGIVEPDSEAGRGLAAEDRPAPYPVGLEKPNLWRVCGLSGNVSEWVQDAYEPGDPGDDVEWDRGRLDRPAAPMHVVRARPLESPNPGAAADRAGVDTSAAAPTRGFRVIAVLPPAGGTESSAEADRSSPPSEFRLRKRSAHA